MRIAGIALILALYIAIMVRSSFLNAYKPQELYSIYNKIFFTNYMQLVGLTAQLNLDWPSFVSNLSNPQKGAATISDQMFSVECFLADDSDDAYINVYFQQLTIKAVMPAILAFFACLFWLVVFMFKRDSGVLKKKLVATLVVLFFFVHPNIVHDNFAMFSCTELMPGELWLNDNNDIRFYGAKHAFYSVAVSLPALIVWGVGVPTLILFKLKRMKDKLDHIDMKLSFGFIYSGFKRSRFYWEFVIMYRKIIIICCIVFIGNSSVKVQALTIMAIIAFFAVLQYFIQPYTHFSLNRLEMRAILAAAVTIYCGLYYLSRDLGEAVKIMFFVMMIAINVHFLYYFIIKLTSAVAPMVINVLPFLGKILNIPPGDSFPEADSKGPAYSSNSAIVFSEKFQSLARNDLVSNPTSDIENLNDFCASFLDRPVTGWPGGQAISTEQDSKLSI
jgi:hypothetical protein